MVGQPLFSIIVPTRSRARTLRHTLETCARVDFDDYEVIIGDNASTDETAEVAAAFAARHPRFRHCRSAQPLSAAANFERLLDISRGAYLIYIGDDDGIYRHALTLLAGLIDKYRPEALNWLPEGFIWPTVGRAVVPIYPLEVFNGVFSETREIAFIRTNQVYRLNYFSLTGFDLYHGCIARTAIDRARARFGRLFAGPIPDVAASYLLMEEIEYAVLTGLSATVAGMSSESIGHAFTAPEPSAAQIEIRSGFLRDNRATFPTVDPLFEAFTLLTPYLATFADYLRMVDGSLRRLESSCWAEAMLDQIALDYPSDRLELTAKVNDFFARAAAEGAPAAPPITPEAIEARRETGDARARHPWTPHLFHPVVMQATLATVPYPGRGRPGGAAYRYTESETALFIDARTPNPVFSINDFAILREHLLGAADPDYANAYLAYPKETHDAFMSALARDAAEDLLPPVAPG